MLILNNAKSPDQLIDSVGITVLDDYSGNFRVEDEANDNKITENNYNKNVRYKVSTLIGELKIKIEDDKNFESEIKEKVAPLIEAEVDRLEPYFQYGILSRPMIEFFKKHGKLKNVVSQYEDVELQQLLFARQIHDKNINSKRHDLYLNKLNQSGNRGKAEKNNKYDSRDAELLHRYFGENLISTMNIAKSAIDDVGKRKREGEPVPAIGRYSDTMVFLIKKPSPERTALIGSIHNETGVATRIRPKEFMAIAIDEEMPKEFYDFIPEQYLIVNQDISRVLRFPKEKSKRKFN